MDVTSAFKDICKNDDHAFGFCLTFWAFVHTLDDLYDADPRPSAAAVVQNTIAFVEVLALNPFFQAHKLALLATIRVGAFSWVASEEWRDRSVLRDKMIAEVMKSGYQETIFLVASLVGGVDHALQMQRLYRDYEFG